MIKKDYGIIQGDPLAPILFAIYLDEMLTEIDITREMMDDFAQV